MNRLQKTMVAFAAFLVTLLLAVNYVYQQITPRALGTNPFPLKQVANYCVSEQIREISEANHGVILVKTNKSLSAYEAENSSLLWSVSINTQGESFPPVSSGDQVFVTDEDELSTVDLQTGILLWTVSLADNNTWIPGASDKFVLLNTVSGPVELYDAESGNKLWTIAGGRGYTPAFIDENNVYVIDHGIKALSASTGQLSWQVTNQLATGIGTFRDDVLFYVEYPGNQTFDLVAFNVVTRSELWRRNFIDNNPREFSLYDGFLFMIENNALYKINKETGATVWSKELSDAVNLSFIEQQIFVLEQFHRQIHLLDLTTGEDLAVLEISIPRVVGARAQEMVTMVNYLVFSRGCEIFIYSR